MFRNGGGGSGGIVAAGAGGLGGSGVGGSGGIGGSGGGSSNGHGSVQTKDSKTKDRSIAAAFSNHNDKAGPEVQDIRIVVLGASKVGKTCLVQQFVHCSCPEAYSPTRKPAVYHPSITVNEHCYDARIVDCPTLRYFPTDSLQEFSDFRGFGLRSASGYVLVFDITDDSSFAYIRRIRESIQEQGIDAPILVAANKADLVSNGRTEKDNSKDAAKDKNKEARRETSNIVRKQWKCMFVECSAKYNWHVGTAFRELLKAIDHKDFGHKPTSARVQEALRRNQCSIM